MPSGFSRVPLFVTPMDYSPPGSSVHGIFQPRILEWVAISPLGNLPNPGIKPMSLLTPALASRFFTTSPTWEGLLFYEVEWSEVAQSCPTVCNPVDCSPLGSPVYGILWARILEWVAVSFSRDLPGPGIEPRSPALHADALTSEPPIPMAKSLFILKFTSMYFPDFITFVKDLCLYC